MYSTGPTEAVCREAVYGGAQDICLEKPPVDPRRLLIEEQVVGQAYLEIRLIGANGLLFYTFETKMRCYFEAAETSHFPNAAPHRPTGGASA